jgi:dienelactone hydrolase
MISHQSDRAGHISTGRDAVLTEYPGAQHSFDNPLGNKTPKIPKGGQSFRACKLQEEPFGTIIHAESGEPFTGKDPCLQRDAHTGYNEAAANAARIAVKELMRSMLKTGGPIYGKRRVSIFEVGFTLSELCQNYRYLCV